MATTKKKETKVMDENKKSTGQAQVSWEDFVRTVAELAQQNGTKVDVAKRLNISEATVSARLASYKKKGINLPQLARKTSNRINVDEANKMLAELMKD